MTIKTIIFDIGNVLVHINWHRGHNLLADVIADKDGQALSGDKLHQHFFSPDQHELWNEYGTGQIGEAEFIANFCHNLSAQNVVYTGQPPLLLKALSSVFEPIPERIETLNALIANQKYQIALLSDTNPLHANYIENHAAAIFTQIETGKRFYSHQLGCQKKNGAEIYTKTLAELKARPDESLMIDDRIQNKPGADEIGLNFLLIQPNEDLNARLQQDWNIIR